MTGDGTGATCFRARLGRRPKSPVLTVRHPLCLRVRACTYVADRKQNGERPGVQRFGLTVSAHGEEPWLDTPANPVAVP